MKKNIGKRDVGKRDVGKRDIEKCEKLNSSLDIEKLWKILLTWFCFVILVFIIAREWGVVVFGMTYGLIFGWKAYRFRFKVRDFFKQIGLHKYKGFLLLSILVTVTEEIYCYSLGNRIAHQVLVDRPGVGQRSMDRVVWDLVFSQSFWGDPGRAPGRDHLCGHLF